MRRDEEMKKLIRKKEQGRKYSKIRRKERNRETISWRARGRMKGGDEEVEEERGIVGEIYNHPYPLKASWSPPTSPVKLSSSFTSFQRIHPAPSISSLIG